MIAAELFKGIDKATLSPEFQKVYEKLENAHKEMLSDYTKKTTEVSDERKRVEGFTTEFKTTQQKLQELEDANQKLIEANKAWGVWHDTNFKNPSSHNDGEDDNGGRKVTDLDGTTMVERDRIEKMEKTINELNVTLRNTQTEFNNKVGFTLQLIELAKTKGDKFNMNEVIKTATEKGYTNLEEAYEYLHRDDIIEERAKKIADEKVKEYIDSHRGSDPSGGVFHPPSIFRLPENARIKDRGYSAAVEKALNDQRELELKG